jgi:hypothetical protein
MSIMKRLLLFVMIGLAYLVIKEFLILYQAAKSLHPFAAYGLVIILSLFVLYFAILPLFSMLRLPGRFSPTRNPNEIQPIIEKRMKYLRRNPNLLGQGFDFSSVRPDQAGYDQIIKALQPEVKQLQKKYVIQVFYTTAIAQNGFLDALLILTLSVNLIKDLFVLYNGRVSNRVLWVIGKMVFQSMLIGGSEGAEYAVDEIFSKLFSKGVKSIPFASKILGSLVDGFVNAALVTRIGLITQNYCEMIFIESERSLYPAHKTVTSTTQILVSDLLNRISREIRSLAKNKAKEAVLSAVNPVEYVMNKALDRPGDQAERQAPLKQEWLQETSEAGHNPFRFMVRKLTALFK